MLQYIIKKLVPKGNPQVLSFNSTIKLYTNIITSDSNPVHYDFNTPKIELIKYDVKTKVVKEVNTRTEHLFIKTTLNIIKKYPFYYINSTFFINLRGTNELCKIRFQKIKQGNDELLILTYNSSITDPDNHYEILIDGKNIYNVHVDESLTPIDSFHIYSLKTILTYVSDIYGWGSVPVIDV